MTKQIKKAGPFERGHAVRERLWQIFDREFRTILQREGTTRAPIVRQEGMFDRDVERLRADNLAALERIAGQDGASGVVGMKLNQAVDFVFGSKAREARSELGKLTASVSEDTPGQRTFELARHFAPEYFILIAEHEQSPEGRLALLKQLTSLAVAAANVPVEAMRKEELMPLLALRCSIGIRKLPDQMSNVIPDSMAVSFKALAHTALVAQAEGLEGDKRAWSDLIKNIECNPEDVIKALEGGVDLAAHLREKRMCERRAKEPKVEHVFDGVLAVAEKTADTAAIEAGRRLVEVMRTVEGADAQTAAFCDSILASPECLGNLRDAGGLGLHQRLTREHGFNVFALIRDRWSTYRAGRQEFAFVLQRGKYRGGLDGLRLTVFELEHGDHAGYLDVSLEGGEATLSYPLTLDEFRPLASERELTPPTLHKALDERGVVLDHAAAEGARSSKLFGVETRRSFRGRGVGSSMTRAMGDLLRFQYGVEVVNVKLSARDISRSAAIHAAMGAVQSEGKENLRYDFPLDGGFEKPKLFIKPPSE